MAVLAPPREASVLQAPPTWRRLLVVAGLLWLPLLGWWLALFPAVMTKDSLNSWAQIVTGRWDNHHPVPYTGLIWLATRVWFSPAAGALLQTVLVALGFAFLAVTLDARYRSAPFAVIGAFVLVLTPWLGAFSVTLWKDVPTAAFAAALVALLLRPPRAHVDAEGRAGAFAHRGRWLAGLAALSGALALVRWNGVATAGVAALIAAPLLPRGLRWRSFVAMVVAAVVGLGILLAVPHVLPVKPPQPVDTMQGQLSELAVVAHRRPHAFTPEEISTLSRVAPFADWRRSGHTCLTINPVTFTMLRYQRHVAALDANASALQKVWLDVALRHPLLVLRIHLCRASLAWRPVGTEPSYVLSEGVAANTYGLHTAPVSHRAAVAAHEFIRVWKAKVLQPVLWRPMPWLLLVLALQVALGFVRRRWNWRLLLITLAVPIGVLVSFAVDPGAQDTRYTAPGLYVMQLLAASTAGALLLALWRRVRRT